MYDAIKRVVLSGIDIQRSILDYVEQAVEKGVVGEKGEKPLEYLRTKVGDDIHHMKEVVEDVVKNTLHTGLHHIDDKLTELNERISALEKKKPAPDPCARGARKATPKTRKSTKKTRKPTPKKRPPSVDEEPIIDG